MPKYDEIGRRVDLLEDTAGSADRARRINSLNRTVSDLAQQDNQRKLDYGKEINSLSKEQKRMMQRLEMERDEFTSETVQSYNSVLKGLGNTINRLAFGVKYITTETAKATKDAIGQYARAIGEDISINKQNTVAMALSGASPIFGYFASKFMETDVFQRAAQNIREKLGQAVSGGFSRLGRLAGIGRKVKNEEELPSMQRGGYVKKGGTIRVHAAEVVMPAEKVMKQIDKAKDSAISRQMGTTMGDMSDTLVEIQDEIGETQEKTGNIINTFLQEFDKVNKEESEVGDTLQHVVSEIKTLRIAMLGVAPRWETALQNTLDKHPFFKSMFKIYKFFDVMMPGAFKWLFGRRSKYAGDVIKAGKSQNVFDRIVETTGLLYTGLMPKFDELNKYVKELTEFTTKSKTTAPGLEYEESNFDKIKKFFSTKKEPKAKRGIGKFLFDYVLEQAGPEVAEEMKKVGISGFGDLLHPKKILTNVGVRKEDIEEKMGKPKTYAKGSVEFVKSLPKEAKKFLQELLLPSTKEKLGAAFGTVGGISEKVADTTKEYYKESVSFLKDIAKAEKDREEREGPHSPSMAENISVTAETAKKEAKRQGKFDQEELKTLKKTHTSIKGFGESINDFAKKGVKKMGDWLMMGLMFVVNLLGTIISSAFSGLMGLISGIASAIGIPLPGKRFIGKALSKIGAPRLGARVRGAGMKRGLGGMAKGAAKGVKTAYETGGVKAAAGAAGRGVGKVGGTAIGRGIGAVGKTAGKVGKALLPGIGATAKFGLKTAGKIGMGALKLGGRFLAAPIMALTELGFSAYDAIKAIINPEEFASSRLAAGVGAFLGGTDSGWSGALSGALKWGTVGAGIGTMFGGPIGTAIGGGAGALLGALVGFVGGKNIAQGIDWLTGGLKSILSGAWEVFKFPFKALWESIKSLWVLMKWGWKNSVGKLIDSVSEWFSDWWSKTGPVKEFVEGSIDSIAKSWNKVKDGFSEFIGMFSRAWDAIANFAAMAKDWLIDKLSALGPIWDWIKDWIIEPVSKGVSEIQEGKTAENLEKFLNEESPVKEAGDRHKNLMSDIADSAAKEHRINTQAQLDAMKRSAEETSEAISDANKKGMSNSSKQTTVLARTFNTRNNVASNTYNNQGVSAGAQSSYDRIISYGAMM